MKSWLASSDRGCPSTQKAKHLFLTSTWGFTSHPLYTWAKNVSVHCQFLNSSKSPNAKEEKEATFPLSAVWVTYSYETPLCFLTVSGRLIASTAPTILPGHSLVTEPSRVTHGAWLTGIQPWGCCREGDRWTMNLEEDRSDKQQLLTCGFLALWACLNDEWFEFRMSINLNFPWCWQLTPGWEENTVTFGHHLTLEPTRQWEAGSTKQWGFHRNVTNGEWKSLHSTEKLNQKSAFRVGTGALRSTRIPNKQDLFRTVRFLKRSTIFLLPKGTKTVSLVSAQRAAFGIWYLWGVFIIKGHDPT